MIESEQREIERRWLVRVRNDLGATPGAGLSELRDGMPDYLRALGAVLRAYGADFPHSAQTAWAKVAREHGVTRVRLGFDIAQLVHEFVVLRAVIREVAQEHGLDGRDPLSVLTDALDPAISASVEAYVEACNYDARRSQAETIGFLTHELRNPLSAATMATAHLRKTALPEQERTLSTIERSHQRLNTLIDSMLLNEKLDAGEFESHPSETRLGDVVEPAIEAARLTAQRKGLEFRVTYNRDSRVRLDLALTRSVIENLADNAVKYTDAGWVDLVVDELPDAIVIHLRDTCHGLSPEELRVIFEPFRRGRSSKAGTGLGLSIARRAVEAQGGSIHAESPEPSGCHFWLTLPKRTAET